MITDKNLWDRMCFIDSHVSWSRQSRCSMGIKYIEVISKVCSSNHVMSFPSGPSISPHPPVFQVPCVYAEYIPARGVSRAPLTRDELVFQ